eukprot:41037_1
MILVQHVLIFLEVLDYGATRHARWLDRLYVIVVVNPDNHWMNHEYVQFVLQLHCQQLHYQQLPTTALPTTSSPTTKSPTTSSPTTLTSAPTTINSTPSPITLIPTTQMSTSKNPTQTQKGTKENIDEILVFINVTISNDTSISDVLNSVNKSIMNYINTLTAHDENIVLDFDILVISGGAQKYITINATIKGLDDRYDLNSNELLYETQTDLQNEYNDDVVVKITIVDKRIKEKIESKKKILLLS